MQKEQITKAITIIVKVLVTLGAAFIIVAYTAAELGAEWGQNILAYISERWGFVVGGGVVAGLGVLVKVVASIKGESNFSIKQLEGMGQTLGGAFDEIKGATDNMTAINTQMQGEIDLLNEQLAESKKQEKDRENKLNTIMDMLLVYVFKNNKDETLDELRAAFQESELLKNVRAMRELETADLKPHAKEEARQVAATAKEIIAETKKSLKRIV